MLKLKPNRYYHIYNRGNNREKLFYTEENYDYFLNRFQHFCSHIFEVYAFCLLSNHFHLLVSVRPQKEQMKMFQLKNLRSKQLRLPSRHLGNFFNSYSLSINKQEERTGSLFERPFKRLEVDSEVYFRTMIIYIHQNPLRHGFVDSITDYPFSSYQHYLNEDESFLNKEKTLSLFGGIENFKVAHQQQMNTDIEKFKFE